ncbi:MAG: hypothetical protein Q9173_003677 [Seirophora scorigena]
MPGTVSGQLRNIPFLTLVTGLAIAHLLLLISSRFERRRYLASFELLQVNVYETTQTVPPKSSDVGDNPRRPSPTPQLSASETAPRSSEVVTLDQSIFSDAASTVASADPSSAVFTTYQSVVSTAASILASAETASASSGPKKAHIIIGVVVGILVATAGLWLVWRCKKKKSSTTKEGKKQADEKWTSTQNPPIAGLGLGVYGDEYYSAAGSHTNSPTRGEMEPGSSTDRARDSLGRQALYSPQSLLQPSVIDVSPPSSNTSPNNHGLFPPGVPPSEISGEPSATPELSPNPEASQINRYLPASSHISVGGSGQCGQASRPLRQDETGMRPNLAISHDNQGSHVMSWMSYEGGVGPSK